MKKLSLATFLFIVIFAFVQPVSADVIPPDSRSVERCAKIVNLEEFPDIILVGTYSGPGNRPPETYQIKPDECLTKGYKFNTLDIYWNTPDKGTAVDPGHLLMKNLDPYGGYVSTNDPLVKETVEYSIVRTDSTFILYKSRIVASYNNTQDLEGVTVFPPPEGTAIQPESTNPPQPGVPAPPVRRNFWQSFICLFSVLC